MVTPDVYCAEELKWGVTTVITDPHEVANVAGVEGIRFMLDVSANVPIDYFVQLPSCVPATLFEHNGAEIKPDDIAKLINEPGILGLSEMMNYPGVLGCDAGVMEMIVSARNRIIDGHAPALSGKDLQAYAAAGIRTDHESTSFEEALEKIRAGLAVLVREGSAAKDLRGIIAGVVASGLNTDRMAFCTDDKHIADIRRVGTIRHCIRESISLGLEPELAYRMASLNAANIYGLKGLGAVAPGYQADMVVLSDLEDVAVSQVYKRGIRVFPGEFKHRAVSPRFRNSINIAPLKDDSFQLPKPKNGGYPVIHILENQIITEKSFIGADLVSVRLQSNELCKIAVIERHHATGHTGVGLLSGYGLKNGAVATTVGHDSHNIIVVGTNDADMFYAVKEIQRMQGGYVLIRDKKTLGAIPLPVYGLMSACEPDKFITDLEELTRKARDAGVSRNIDPFITLSFLALPLLPKIRITDMGVFDVEKFEFIH